MIGGPRASGGIFRVPVKRKVFISYHHGGDQHYYDAFSTFFAETYDVFHDKSLERAYNSDNADYVRWQIRQNDISGSSCTIVLCGAATHERKYVDWEIKATLDKQHGLIGVWLPTLPLAPNGGTEKPARLQDNVDSGYAQWVRWDELTADVIKVTIEAAIGSPARLIMNRRPLRVRNG
jgi:Thoeris protein ThsB, TIR-like domain